MASYKILFITLTCALLSDESMSISNGMENTSNKGGYSTDALSIIDNLTGNNKSSPTSSASTGLENKTNDAGSVGEKKDCDCVSYNQCNSIGNGNSSNDGDPQNILGVVDIRESFSSNGTAMNIKNGCPHYFDVCCTDVKTGLQNATELSTNNDAKPDTFMIFKNWTHKECGRRNQNGIGFKITGATKGESQYCEYPWVVIVTEAVPVQIDGPDGKQNVTRHAFICGGSLLTPTVVLTAAHCVFEIANSPRYRNLNVRAGEWDTQTTDEPLPYQDRAVKEVIIHHQLLRAALYNDIALLILEDEVKLAPNVDTICLPPTSISAKDFDGQTCFSGGWGKDSFGETGKYQAIMKSIQIPIVPRSDCQVALRKTRLGERFILHDSFICAGGKPGNDACVGDGGSPLVCKSLNAENYVQIGIVDWGIGCGTEVPAVYVNVPKFVPWILDKLKSRNIDAKYCTLPLE